jgi:hypothetical protein
MRFGVRTMTKKAEKNQMESITCTEKCAFVYLSGLRWLGGGDCGVITSGHPGASRMTSHVGI